ncbi:hypothetical protein DFP73DRAFT_194471 [Morchella snyderi]|nr:hypothetical protein DFP73DRAFT_194471 [Morchella snyderi]
MSESLGTSPPSPEPGPSTPQQHPPTPHLRVQHLSPPTSYSLTATDLRQESDDAVTCIVCLSDLPQDSIPVTGEYDPVARLVPCNHAMHNSCLVPWMERANSCPICRATFNEVSVSATLSGHILETYPVEDRIQVTEYESQTLNHDEEVEGACEVCIRDNNEDVLLVCDDCSRSYHTYCLGLDAIPQQNSWYCSRCSERHIAAQLAGFQRSGRRRGVRTVGEIRRVRRQDQRDMESRQDRAWQNAWQRLDSDLGERALSAAVAAEQRITNQRDAQVERMIRRREVAAAQIGEGPNGFNEQLAWMIPTSRPRTFPDHQQPISEEEQSAWRMFDIAEGIEKSPCKRSRRNSQEITRSPGSDNGEKPRRKRPRTRRDSQLTDGTTMTTEAPSGSSTVLAVPTIPSTVPATSMRDREQAGFVPTASGSYLGHILESIAKSAETAAPDPPQVGLWGIDLTKMRPLSPEPSNAASPRSRPTSPVAQSPYIIPSLLRSRPHSPIETSQMPLSPSSPTRRIPIISHLQPAPTRAWESSLSPPTSRANSPIQRQQQLTFLDEDPGSDDARGGASSSSDTDSISKKHRHHCKHGVIRSAITLQVKADIANMVRSVLKPYYPEKLSKDDFTQINKSVSRKLYQLVEADEGSDIAGDKEKWIKFAEEEVMLAVECL